MSLYTPPGMPGALSYPSVSLLDPPLELTTLGAFPTTLPHDPAAIARAEIFEWERKMMAKQLLDRSLAYPRTPMTTYPLGFPVQSRSLYVSGLPDDADDLLLYKTFGSCGAIESVKAVLDPSGKCKGIGFVNFVEAAHARATVEQGKIHPFKVGHRDLIVNLQEPEHYRGRRGSRGAYGPPRIEAH